jgi:hypothetical protein
LSAILNGTSTNKEKFIMFAGRPLMLALTVLLFLGGLANATDFVAPKQAIQGAEEPIGLGELVTLSISAPEKTANLASTSYDWKVFDGANEKKFARDVEGKVFFGAGIQPKKFLAVVAITHVFIVKQGDKVSEVATKTVLLSTTVTVGGNEPAPTPPAPPSPDNGPTFQDGKFGLGKAAWSWVNDKVAAEARPAGARALAGVFRDVASKIAAGTLKDTAEILKTTKAANEQALGANLKFWDGWFALLADKLFALSDAGQLGTAGDYAAAWQELAAGLDQVR